MADIDHKKLLHEKRTQRNMAIKLSSLKKFIAVNVAGVQFQIRTLIGLEYSRRLEELRDAERRAVAGPDATPDQIKDAQIPDKRDSSLQNEAMLGVLVGGWSGVETDDGQPLPARLDDGSYNLQAFEMLMSIDEVYLGLWKALNKQNEAATKELEAAAKN